ncbi:MAG TPA: pyruvate kinase [Candidatus Bathyarchaeia archaeon]|nr:pyruvate kinase [Candidatus Bathyarchaeia archaeon]
MYVEKTKTKIVCTIGPATSSRHVIGRLIQNGMNVARLNLSHGTLEEHTTRICAIRTASQELRTPIGILVDLPGPKIRVGKVFPEPIVLREGAFLTLTGRHMVGNQSIVSISHPRVLKELKRGDLVFLEDGTVRLKVNEIRNSDAICRIVRGGHLSSGKGVNFPEKKLSLSALTPRDIQLLEFAVDQGVDFVGISFATSGSDIEKASRIISKRRSKIWVIAKIETKQAVSNIDEIMTKADGIMVARGDLGVEMDVEEIPELQKKIIHRSNSSGKPVITATQMLESMVNNSTPTRAEVTDIANAIIDGTDGIMLSEETAVGKYPIEAVRVMKHVAAATERSLPYESILDSRQSLLKRDIVQDAISFSACAVAYELEAGCIVAHTRTGITAHRVSKFRPSVPIIALTSDPPVMNRLSLLWGVYPYQVKKLKTTAEIFSAAKRAAVDSGLVTKVNNRVVVVCGDPSSPRGTTDLLRVQTI